MMLPPERFSLVMMSDVTALLADNLEKPLKPRKKPRQSFARDGRSLASYKGLARRADKP